VTEPTAGHAAPVAAPDDAVGPGLRGPVETDSRNLPFITPWDRPQHEGAVRFPTSATSSSRAGAGFERAGFVILQGCRNPHRSVELKRMVLQTARARAWAGLRAPAQAHGLPRPACAPLLAGREVAQHARWRCTGEGFVEEGRLRESVRLTDTAPTATTA
jgi:diamine N-acetyltransferase